MQALPHAFILVCGLLVFLQGRYSMNTDGMSYLDMSAGVIQAEPWRLVNAYWSPLYPFVLGVGRLLLGGLLPDEFELVQVVNLTLFLFAWIAVAKLARVIYTELGQTSSSEMLWPLTLAVAGGVFASYVAEYLVVTMVTPDILLLGIVAMSHVEGVRVASGDDARLKWLGAWLGLGCLTKVIAMPFALAMFLTILWLRRSRFPLRAVVAAALVFACVLALWVVPLSVREGRPTLGEVAKLNRAWSQGLIPPWRYWTGEQPGTGVPTHGPERLLQKPPVYYFGGVFNVTYPLWYDPAYWHAGFSNTSAPTAPRSNLRAAPVVAQGWTLKMGTVLLGDGLGILPIGLLVVLAFGRRRGSPRSAPSLLLLMAPGVACIVLYTMIGGIAKGRYVAPFWIPAVVLAAAVAASGCDEHKWWSRVLLGASVAVGLLFCVTPKIRSWISSIPSRNLHLEEALELQALGLPPGAEVAVLGNDFEAYWAAAGRYRIVADVEMPLLWFCTTAPEVRQRVRDELAGRGVAALVGRRLSSHLTGCDNALPVGSTLLMMWPLQPAESDTGRQPRDLRPGASRP